MKYYKIEAVVRESNTDEQMLGDDVEDLFDDEGYDVQDLSVYEITYG